MRMSKEDRAELRRRLREGREEIRRRLREELSKTDFHALRRRAREARAAQAEAASTSTGGAAPGDTSGSVRSITPRAHRGNDPDQGGEGNP